MVQGGLCFYYLGDWNCCWTSDDEVYLLMIYCLNLTRCDNCGKKLCYIDCFQDCKVIGSYLQGDERVCCECYEGKPSPECEIEEARRKN